MLEAIENGQLRGGKLMLNTVHVETDGELYEGETYTQLIQQDEAIRDVDNNIGLPYPYVIVDRTSLLAHNAEYARMVERIATLEAQLTGLKADATELEYAGLRILDLEAQVAEQRTWQEFVAEVERRAQEYDKGLAYGVGLIHYNVMKQLAAEWGQGEEQ